MKICGGTAVISHLQIENRMFRRLNQEEYARWFTSALITGFGLAVWSMSAPTGAAARVI